jgi:soluble lytic murein transglycosylase-like protein
VFRRVKYRFRACTPAYAAALLAFAVCPFAHAHTHITLRNGFELDCARTETLDATHTRLYMAADDASYQDLRTADILRVETLPDPPPPVIAAVVASPAATTSADPTPAELHQLFTSAGAAHNIDVDLLAAVAKTESNGRAHAVSRAGAQGIMQLMPATARTLGVTDAFRPDQNVAGGAAYLDSLLTRYRNNLALALAAYNAGPGAVDRYHGVPPFHETRAYVAHVIREFNKRKTASLSAVATAVR